MSPTLITRRECSVCGREVRGEIRMCGHPSTTMTIERTYVSVDGLLADERAREAITDHLELWRFEDALRAAVGAVERRHAER